MASRLIRSIAGGAIGVLALSSAIGTPAASAASKTTTVRTEAQLRDAVAKANARPGKDRIKLAASIRFNAAGGDTDADGPEAGDLDVTDALVIYGQGNTIDANGVDRIFDVTAGDRLEMYRVVLTNGAPADGTSGGAVRSAGSVVFARGVARDNTVTGAGASGGAFTNDGGFLAVRGSRVTDNTADRAGGGIESAGGRVVVRGSGLIGNTAVGTPGNGGALHFGGSGSAYVVDSRVTRNTANEGGGLWNSSGGSFVVEDSLVGWNTAQGPASTDGGGGLYNDGGSLTVRRTTVRNNHATGAAGSGGGVLNNAGTLVVERSKLLYNDSQRAGGAIEANAGTTRVRFSELMSNQTGAAPGNGGALHLTGAGNVSFFRSDVTRNTAALEGGGLWNSATGTMSVNRTFVFRNVARGADPDNGGGGLYNDGGTLNVDRSTVRANNATGTSGSGGGALNNGGTLNVDRTKFMGNKAMRAGGAIEARGGGTTVRRSDLLENSTGANPGNGGGLHLGSANMGATPGQVSIIDSRVKRNTATLEGGGLWNAADGTMTVRGSYVGGNTAQGTATDNGGGGLYNDGGNLTVRDSAVSYNSANAGSGSGGGVLNNAGALSVQNVTMRRNTALRAGGGLEFTGARATGDLDRVRLYGNRTGNAPGNGGGIHVGAGMVDYQDGRVLYNRAASEGGGLWNNAGATLTVNGVGIRCNRAPVGPNVYNNPPGGTFTVNGQAIAPGPNNFSTGGRC